MFYSKSKCGKCVALFFFFLSVVNKTHSFWVEMASIRQNKTRCLSFEFHSNSCKWTYFCSNLPDLLQNAIKRKIDLDVQPLSVTQNSQLAKQLDWECRHPVNCHRHHQIIIITLRTMRRMYIFAKFSFMCHIFPHCFRRNRPKFQEIQFASFEQPIV